MDNEDPVLEKLHYRICKALGLLLDLENGQGSAEYRNRQGARETAPATYREAVGVAWSGLIIFVVVVSSAILLITSLYLSLAKVQFGLSLAQAGGITTSIAGLSLFVTQRDISRLAGRLISRRGRWIYYAARDFGAVTAVYGGVAWALGEVNVALIVIYAAVFLLILVLRRRS